MSIRPLMFVIGVLMWLANPRLLAQLPVADGARQLAPPQLSEIDGRVRADLQRMSSLLEQQQFSAASDSARILIDEHGKKLVPRGAVGEFKRYVQLRDVVHHWLCGLQGDAALARQIYRQHVDPAARELYENGFRQRDASRLKRVVRDFFSSTWGDNATLALGEMAFQAGDYPAARHYWNRLLPSISARDEWGVIQPTSSHAYPDSEVPVADVHARMIIASIFEGDLRRASVELDQFERDFPGAIGRLAGQSVNYVQALREQLARAEAPSALGGREWGSFAGAVDRNGKAPQLGMVTLQPEWRIRVESSGSYDRFAAERIAAPASPVTDDPNRLCSYLPVVSGDNLLLASRELIHCFDLRSGQAVFWADQSDGSVYSWRDDPLIFHVSPSRRAFGVPRFTLTAQGQRVFAVLGNRATYRIHHDGGPSLNHLVGIDLAQQGRLLFPSTAAPGPGWAFEGAPLVREADVTICVRENGDVPAFHVGCFRSGKIHWLRRIAFGEPIGMGQADLISQQMLTRVGGTLFVTSNLGVIAALDASDGDVLWMTEYPRHLAVVDDPLVRPWHLLRDSIPCIHDRGRLLVAPADCRDVFALDAATGRLLWRTEQAPSDIVHLLGTANGRLIASGRRLWWIDLENGRLSAGLPSNPFPVDVQSSPTGFGRGILTSTSILWPARGKSDAIYEFSHRTGRMTRQPIDLGAAQVSAGNLLVTRDYLIVAGPDEVVAFRRLGKSLPPTPSSRQSIQ